VAGGPASLAVALARFGYDVSLFVTEDWSDDDHAACRRQGVRVISAPRLDVVVASRWLTESYQLYRALRGSRYDAIVFEGHDAYCTVRAKQLDIDFDSAAVVAHFDGPSEPRLESLSKSRVGELATDRLVLELADGLVCDAEAAEWWTRRGWPLPSRRHLRSGGEGEAEDAAGWAEVLRPPAERPRRRAVRGRVSVVVPFHERTAYLHLCLEALSKQTYSDLEVLVADDGSVSQSAKEYLGELRSREWPWPLRILDLPHSGVAAARNEGARAASGELVLFVDDDDVPFENLAEVLVRGISSSGADVVAAGARVFRSEAVPDPYPGDKVTIPFGEPREFGLLGNHFGPQTCLWRRSAFEEVGGFRDVFVEDWDILARAALRGARIVGTPEPLYWYRVAPAGRFTGATLERRLEARSAIAEAYAEHLPDGMRLLPLLVAAAYGQVESHERDTQPPRSMIRRAASRARSVYARAAAGRVS
jgi:GT2 family glycosyltransferase